MEKSENIKVEHKLQEEKIMSPEKLAGTNIPDMLGSAGTALKDGIVGSLKGLQESHTDDIEQSLSFV